MHRIKYVMLGLLFGSCLFASVIQKENRSSKYVPIQWTSLTLGSLIPEVHDSKIKVLRDTNETLSIDVENSSWSEYWEYIDLLRSTGFVIDENQLTDTLFIAYDTSGNKVTALYCDGNESMRIELFTTHNFEQLEWKDTQISEYLPDPGMTKGVVLDRRADSLLSVIAGDVSKDEYRQYVEICKETLGYDKVMLLKDSEFISQSENGFKIHLTYHGNQITQIDLLQMLNP